MLLLKTEATLTTDPIEIYSDQKLGKSRSFDPPRPVHFSVCSIVRDITQELKSHVCKIDSGVTENMQKSHSRVFPAVKCLILKNYRKRFDFLYIFWTDLYFGFEISLRNLFLQSNPFYQLHLYTSPVQSG